MTAEEWRPIAGFDSYFVSDQGRVMSTKYTKPRLMHVTKGDPYPRVQLSRDNRQYMRRVHRLVAEAFLGPAPEGQEVRHLNGDHKDPRLVNLRWGTRAENMQDTVRHGTHYWAKRTHCPQGHEYTPENTLSRAGNGRTCRTCHCERTRAYQAKVRAADRDKRNAYQREWRARCRAANTAA